MKINISVLIFSIVIITACVNVTVDTKDAAHEAGSLIRDGVKGSIDLYKESKKNDTLRKDSVDNQDTVSLWQKMKKKKILKELTKKIKHDKI